MSPVYNIRGGRLQADHVRPKPDATCLETVLGLDTIIVPGIGLRLPLT
jgi:hypothetical protein